MKPARLVPILTALLGWCLFVDHCLSQQIRFARPDEQAAISIDADSASRWHSGAYEIMQLSGNVRINQGNLEATADEAVIWVEVPGEGVDPENPESTFRVIVYLESNASINRTGESNSRISDESIFEKLLTRSTVDLLAPTIGGSDEESPIYQRAFNRLRTFANSPNVGWPSADLSSVSQAQFSQQGPVLVSPQTGEIVRAPSSIPTAVPDNQFTDMPAFSAPFQTPQTRAPQEGITLPNNLPDAFSDTGSTNVGNNVVNIMKRDSLSELKIKRFATGENELTLVSTGGVRAVITSDEFNQIDAFRGDRSSTLTILADNIIQWQTTLPDGSEYNELYMDGNVVFAKEGRTIEAAQMFYNVNTSQGTILDAQILTQVPGYSGKVKLKADVIQQLDENNLQAIGAAFTTSRLGFPRYWVQSEAASLTNQPRQLVDEETGQLQFDETTGQPKLGDDYFVQAESNRVYANGIPVFFWPKFRSNRLR